MKSILTVLSLSLIILFTSCNNTTTTNTEQQVNNFDYSGTIKEFIQTSNYTYCLVQEGEVEYWMAISRLEVENGQTLYFNQGYEMKDFHSKELDKTFPSVYFIQDVSTDPSAHSHAHGTSPQAQSAPVMGTTPQKPEIVKKDIKIGKAAGGVTIAELFSNKEKYNGKKVRVRGKITKFNTAIMNRNWAHMQDGTDHDGNFDLTITTTDIVNIDAVVTFEGIIAIDKDFGAGYSYSIIMEEALIADLEEM